MATTRAIEHATVPTSFRVPGVNTFKVTPGSLASDIGMGVLLVLSTGKVAEAAYASDKVDDSQVFYAITAEPFRAANAVAGAVPFQVTDVGIVLLTPGVYIEANMYYDGDGDADDTLAGTEVGTLVILRKVAALGNKVVADKTTSQSSVATFTVVKLVDQPGDVFGRVLVVPTSTFRFGF